MWNLDSYIQGKMSVDDVWKQRPNSHDNFLNYEGEVTFWRGVHSKYVSKHISVNANVGLRERHGTALVDSLFCLCHARHASVSDDSTKKIAYIIHHLFMSHMNWTTKYVLDLKHHVKATGDGHACYWSGGCSQDMTFHISVSVNTHSSIIWSTEDSHVIYEFEVSSPKVLGRKVQKLCILFYCFAEKTLWSAPYQDLLH
jgi:hypothetical protein